MNPILRRARQGLNTLDQLGLWIGLLSLRLLLTWEFGEAGVEKLHGSNWFADIQDQFPWPFKLIPADINWALATGLEVLGAFALQLMYLRGFSMAL